MSRENERTQEKLERQNDRLEKQNDKLEKQNKKLKKKNKAGGNVIIFLLIVIALLAAVMFLFDPFGFGLGAPFAIGGTGGSAAPAAAPAQTTASAVTEAAVTEAPEPDYIEVTVSGATYLYEGSEKTAAEIADICAGKGKGKVRVNDDSATQNAIDELTAALKEKSIELLIG